MAMMMPMAERKPVLGRDLADRLEALRRAHGWTQGQIAYKTGLNKATIYHILAGGRKDPPIGTVMKFAEAFGVSLDELVGLKPLQMPEPVVADAAPPGELQTRVEALEKDLLEIAKGQREILAALQDERSQVRKRKRPA